MRKIIFIALLFGSVLAANAQTCRLQKTVFRPDGLPASGVVVSVFRVMVAGQVFSDRRVDYRTNALGVLLGTDGQPGIVLPQAARVWIYSAITGIPGISANSAFGTQYSVPAKASAQLEELQLAGTVLRTKGDLIVADANGQPLRLPVGANGYVPIADATQPGGIRWGSGGGTAAQVTNTPAGNIAATNVQSALNELDAEKAATAHAHAAADVTSGVLAGVRGGLGAALPTCSGTDKLTSNGTVASCAPDQVGSAVTDGDKGDITVSGSGSSWTVDNNAISPAKLAQVPANTIRGNNTGATANIVNLTVAQTRTLLGLGTADSPTFAGVTASGTMTAGTGGGLTFYDNASQAIFQINGTRAFMLYSSNAGGTWMYIDSNRVNFGLNYTSGSAQLNARADTASMNALSATAHASSTVPAAVFTAPSGVAAIQTPNMTASSANSTGAYKPVVVDSDGKFGVRAVAVASGTPNQSLTTSSVTINFGVTLQEGDIIQATGRYSNNQTLTYPMQFVVMAGRNVPALAYPDANHQVTLTFPGTLTASATATHGSGSANFVFETYRVLRF